MRTLEELNQSILQAVHNRRPGDEVTFYELLENYLTPEERNDADHVLADDFSIYVQIGRYPNFNEIKEHDRQEDFGYWRFRILDPREQVYTRNLAA
jgi:hypothetical protein